MYQIISEENDTVNLQQNIDNRDGIKRVGLRSFTYTLGWYNVLEEDIQKQKERPSRIEPGFYSFQQLADVFQEKGVALNVNDINGIVSLETPDEIKISNGLKKILGFGNKRRFAAI